MSFACWPLYQTILRTQMQITGTTLSVIKDIISENAQDCFGGRNLKGSIHLISKEISVKNGGCQKDVLDILHIAHFIKLFH